jgi:hypothetical protein
MTMSPDPALADDSPSSDIAHGNDLQTLHQSYRRMDYSRILADQPSLCA